MEGEAAAELLVFSTLFVPVRLVIKLKIHMPFGLRSILSTKVYVLELLWFAPSEIRGAVALALVAFLSAIPQYLLHGH